MAFISCKLSRGGKKENDLYSIYLPYGNGSWTAPRDGTVKVIVFVVSYDKSINYNIATCTCMGITAKHSSYNNSQPDKNADMQIASGIVTVTKGITYTATTTSSNTSKQR